MARGRGGLDYDSDVVYVTTSRRKVYPEEISDFDPISSSRKASRITHNALDDSASLSTRSRRQDQALLDDITSRLVNADFTQPVNVVRRSGYTPVPHAGSRRILVVPSSPPMSRRRVAATPPPTRRSLAATTHAARARRAMSVPPMPVHSSVETHMEFAFPEYRPPPRRTTTVKGRYRAGSEPPLPPTADLAVRHAKRYLNRIEAELGIGDNVPVVYPVVTPVTVAPRYRAASVPRHVGHVTGRPPLPRRVPGSPAAPRRHLYRHYVEVDEEPIIPRYASPLPRAPASYSSLRSKTMEARNKLDHTRSLLDRYLPTPLGPENDVQYEVDYKFGELAARMPALEAYRSGSRDMYTPSTGYVPPYKPVTVQRGSGRSGVNIELRNPPPRPRMSDARKRAREVLCKTKRDPTYFSY